MKNINYRFNEFLNLALKILFLFIVVGSIGYFNVQEPDITGVSICFIIITIILMVGTYYGLKKKCNKSLIVAIILISALIIRFLWFYNIDSIPISDFNRMFICAGDFVDGYTDMFKDTAYIARFPHMSMTVLYFALIRGTFSNSLIAIRFINIILSMFNVVLLFFIAKEVFDDENKSIWVCLISAIYPPMIAYNNIYCSENNAVPLLLLSIWMFLRAFNKNNSKKLLLLFLSGISLSITHLFRPIGYLMIIAYIMYIFIYFKDNIKTKIVMNLLVILAFVIPFVGVSYTLIGLNITENPLWHGTEPPSISILKGTNLESGGRWNQDDAELFDKYDRDYEKVDKAAKEVIKKRLTESSPKDLLKFYTLKYVSQWYAGDFSGFCWSEAGLDEAYNKTDYLNIMGKNEGKMFIRLSKEGEFYTQLFFAIVLVLSYIGLYRKNKIKNYKIDIFYIIFCGISLQCLITESQDRYTYPFSWLFIILSMTAFSSNNARQEDKMGEFKYIIKLLRPKQWIKNFFVFGAILFSNNFWNLKIIKSNVITFIAFCFISSTVYIINDIVDVERDKKHPEKCKRPIASGKVSVEKAKIIGVIMALIAFYIAINLNIYIAIVIGIYLLNNLLYSFKFKNIIIVDVLSIAIGFILRVIAGGLATKVETSNWIILSTLFLSLFLGFGKRKNEIVTLGKDAYDHREILSEYTEKLLDQLINIVLTCTIVFYAIYCILGSPFNNFLWTTIFVVFGILRYYYLMYSKGEGGNPTELVLRDKQLIYCIALWGSACILILNI